MADLDVQTMEQARTEYSEKHAMLMVEYGDPVSPHDFYRTVFPSGSLQDAYRVNPSAPHDGKFVAVANVVHRRRADGSTYRMNHYVLDDLSAIRKWTGLVAYLSPCSYLGGAKDLEHLRFVHAFVVDLDYVGIEQLKNLFYQVTVGYVPRPTFIVNSGTGLHLYYVLSDPLAAYDNLKDAYSMFKHALIDLCWNAETSRSGKRQYSGLVQPYRIPGTRSKLDVDPQTGEVLHRRYTVMAFRSGDVWTLKSLLDWKPKSDAGTMYYAERCESIKRVLSGEVTGFKLVNGRIEETKARTKTPLAEAKERWPEWYETRIVKGVPPKRPDERGKWHVNPHVYRWWLSKIRQEAVAGHRYHCIMLLAIYAIKCDVPKETLEADAYGLLETFDARTDAEHNPFTEGDIRQALKAYEHREYATMPIPSIEYFSGLRINRNKRNGRERSAHLKLARGQKFLRASIGEDVLGGRPDKRDLVRDYAAAHPGESHSAIARALGISRPTVIKWLRG